MGVTGKTVIRVISILITSLMLPGQYANAKCEHIFQNNMQKIPIPDSDEEAIKKVIAAYAAAWNERDMTAWGKLFTDDVDYVNRGGGWWQSNEENISGHKLLFKKNPNFSKTYTAEVAKITLLKSDIALAHVIWRWPGVKKPSGDDGDFKGIMTLVLIKKNNHWLIRAIQNTVSV
jgi:uncharacterized protein (TIGR02246 family)